jgi:hypothetical protein
LVRLKSGTFNIISFLCFVATVPSVPGPPNSRGF